ncbi:hypothetical protein FHX44_115116 [Pseudonocardia hierapolitana]|uniref:Outer membrane channel protein CpnT-like N-terminal domain-containing protein n=1 Tax=Pseudonocardia hierapolitana TaxID=1128676 RepID=A0A561SWF6_9PSEU|nr:hypothetical protein [Pseudonocardia hierapolitana]TWF79188.1 hypothetical protein FHX44_115116 [Pseudonocardia hierapolitana]
MTEQPGANPLVVLPENEDAQPLDNFEGGGVVSSWADLNAALSAEHVDPLQVVYTAAGAGLDTLGAIENPLDSLFSAGVGWLIEHVWFLHEPLDALAGDPTQITAQAQTWHKVGGELGAVAQDHRAAAAAISAWEGMAGDGYRGAVDRFGGALEQAGRDATQLADLILSTGAQVGTVRALVRDQIAAWVSEAIQTAIYAGVAALISAGGALGVGAVRLIWSALDLADSIYRTIRRLLDAMTLAGGTAAQLSGAIQQTATAVQAAMPTVKEINDAADELHAGAVIETGKQLTGAEQQQRGWG